MRKLTLDEPHWFQYNGYCREGSSVAQWQSDRLLTGRLQVRVLPGEPILCTFLSPPSSVLCQDFSDFKMQRLPDIADSLSPFAMIALNDVLRHPGKTLAAFLAESLNTSRNTPIVYPLLGLMFLLYHTQKEIFRYKSLLPLPVFAEISDIRFADSLYFICRKPLLWFAVFSNICIAGTRNTS